MRWFFSLLLITAALVADVKQQMYESYQRGEYEAACNTGVKGLSNYRNEEAFLSLYGFACLNADYVDRLAIPMILLGKTAESRKNAAYFSAILMQKQLLINALADDVPLNGLRFPTTDFLLSRVFALFVESEMKKSPVLLQDPEEKRRSYKLYLQKSSMRKTLVIEEIYDKILQKRHIYR